MEETVRLVPSFVTVTLAFAIAAPVGSVTVPVNCPFCTCANALKVRASTANTARQNCNLFIYLPPQKLWRVVFVICTETFAANRCHQPMLPNSSCGRNSYNSVNRNHISRVAASPATAKCAEFCATNYCFVNHVADSVNEPGG